MCERLDISVDEGCARCLCDRRKESWLFRRACRTDSLLVEDAYFCEALLHACHMGGKCMSPHYSYLIMFTTVCLPPFKLEQGYPPATLVSLNILSSRSGHGDNYISQPLCGKRTAYSSSSYITPPHHAALKGNNDISTSQYKTSLQMYLQ